ncbi:cellulase family glycosylhydrolase [Candidatus Sumerlaeota bacterium]|nr:cellulase family glycosylhydrolase [Candidatus Sumerlaeota bacterium]
MSISFHTFIFHFSFLFGFAVAGIPCFASGADMEFVRISKDNRSFVLERSGKIFPPLGFNYDHDENGRLIEDYWVNEWLKLEEDFREMKELGANVVRIHLQVAKFMSNPDQPTTQSLHKLKDLLELSRSLELRLDITGLGCYHKHDVPKWYDELSEKERWRVQANFWEAIAKTCAGNPAVFCYNLMNEPLVPGEKRKPGDWLAPPFGGKCFVQFITLDRADRPGSDIAKDWIRQLTTSIRKHDKKTLITTGMFNLKFGTSLDPKELADELDYISVHIYPERGKVGEAVENLKMFQVGKPIVIEEIFPLNCHISDIEEFMNASREIASGWIGFYWGKTMEECRRSGTIGDAITAEWLRFFQENLAQRR